MRGGVRRWGPRHRPGQSCCSTAATPTSGRSGAKLTPQKWLIGGATTRRKFQDFTLHVEFMISYVPRTRTIWQRPNSGVYLQQRYEIQILDSFGIVMRKHDCGVLYAQVTPKINMCYPPLTWQTYDIDFMAARYDAAGKKTSSAAAR